jgi:hypothetical protein
VLVKEVDQVWLWLCPAFAVLPQFRKRHCKLPFRIRYFPARHSYDTPNAVGFCIECLAVDRSRLLSNDPVITIGFTGDTSFFPELYDEDHLGNCDILIPHISQPELWELLSPEGTKEDTTHLGYRGVEKLMNGSIHAPALTLIGEFWSGLADSRIEIVEGLRQQCKTNRILPGSVGLLVEPETQRVRCSNCEGFTSPDQIRLAPPTNDRKFGPLSYLCPMCHL